MPKSTLYDQFSVHVAFGAKSGPPQYLTNREVKKLTNFLVGCSQIGYALSRKKVISLVRGIVAKKTGKKLEEVTVTTGWWNSFKKRYPQLTLQTTNRLTRMLLPTTLKYLRTTLTF